MKRPILAATLLGLGMATMPALAAQTANQATNMQQQVCPPGQMQNGKCTSLPATPHQQKVLKTGKIQQPDAATRAATGMTTGMPASPETPHQQQVLKGKKTS
jgi:hypothetical protein